MFFNVMDVIFPIMFIVVAGFIVVTIIKGISQWNDNNHAPRLTVEAKVVAKRTNITHRLGKMMEDIRHGKTPNEAYEKNVGTYGRFSKEQGAVKYIDPREE